MEVKFVVCNGVNYLCELTEAGDGRVYLSNAYSFDGDCSTKEIFTDFLKERELGLLQSVTVAGQFTYSVASLNKEQLLLFKELEAKMDQARINALPSLIVEKFEEMVTGK